MACLRSPAASRCLASSSRATITIPTRSFSTTQSQLRQTPTHLTVPKDKVPDYPYGEFRWYKQANHSLYAGAKIRYGQAVSRPRMIKFATQWRPNRHRKRLWSPSLNMFIRTRVTARVLRTIDKLGGIDNYLLGDKAQRIKDLGPAGWALRWKLMQSEVVQARFDEERARLGLPSGAERMAAIMEGGAVVGEAAVPEGLEELEEALAKDEEIVLGELPPGEEERVLDVEDETKIADAEHVHATLVVDAPVETAREAAQETLEDAKKQ